MKKIFSFFAAALLSISMFASKDVVPTDQVLADYYETGQLCVCIYFEGAVCNDIVWAGTYNGWATDPTTMTKFEEVEGYDGWWVAAITDATSSEGDGICGKPVQLKTDGSFDWSYQTGDAESWTLIRGSVNIVAGFSGEADLKGWSTAQPNVLISAYWKNQGSPCVTIPTHDYKIVLDAPLCEGPDKETYAPAIIGDFNGWSEGVPMVLNENTLKYEYTIVKGEEGKSYKFKATTDTDWSNQIQGYNAETSEWKDLDNSVLPVCSKDTTIEIDFSDGAKYKYTKCGQEVPDTIDVTVTLIAPAFCADKAAYADSVQIVGGFDGWSGTLMTKGADNTYTISLQKIVTGTEYKFKAGTGWDVEIVDEEGAGLPNIKFAKGETEITQDLSEYFWKGCPTEPEPLEVDTLDNAKAVLAGEDISLQKGVISWYDNNPPASNTATWTEDIEAGEYAVVVTENNTGSGHKFIFTASFGGTEVGTVAEPADSWEGGDIELDGTFVAAQDGEYTFVLSNGTEWSAAGALYVILKRYEYTALAEIAAQATTAKKVMIDGKMYILVNGVAYDVMGAVVK